MPPITWPDLPLVVREFVEAALGSPVVDHSSQPAGYSPGTADRVVCADGTRAFVKAVGAHQNPDTPGLHRREARLLAALPDGIPVPRLRAWLDSDEWVCLVIEDVDGRHPTTPWQLDELDAAWAALSELAVTTTPCPIPGLDPVVDHLGQQLEQYRRWVDGTETAPADLDPIIRDNLPALAAQAERAIAALAGDTLVHLDLRRDNLLIDPHGAVWLIDWPWAVTGAAWIDPALLILDVLLDTTPCEAGPASELAHPHPGTLDPDALIRRLSARHDLPAEVIAGFLAGMGGFFQRACRLPAPPGLPTLRAFQRRGADAISAWIRTSALVDAPTR